MDNSTLKTKDRFNRIAPFYDGIHGLMEKKILKMWRTEIWRETQGNILEVGVGTGNNIAYYPEKHEVTAVDFSEKMLERAKEKAMALNKKVNFRLMDIQNLEFPDETFDTVISTCVFCSVPNPIQGLKEIKRVCKKDGRILMLEHVRSQKPFIGLLMDLHNPIMVRITGANINRNTIGNLKKAGLTLMKERDLALDIVKYLIITPG